MTAKCALNAKAIVGESPRWSESDQALYWADIHGKTINRFDPISGATKSWLLPERIGCFSFTRSGAPSAQRSGKIIAGMQTGIHLFDLETMQGTCLFELKPANAAIRFNDGRCDSAGRFWAGTMKEGGAERAGALYRYDINTGGTVMVGDMIIPNGLAFSPDSRTLYHSDSRQDYVFAWDHDTATGDIRNQRIFLAMDLTEGRPDGAAVDTEGYYWVCHVNGWRVARYSPEGKIDRVIGLPVQRPTMCAFGGSGLDTLYVTTATYPLSETALAKQPLAGSLFAIDVGVRGHAEPFFAG